MAITLSYIMTTYNKVSYLKTTLPYLLDACKEDEEIVIVDGGSTDGTVDYLKDLYQHKKIHQFISEKDFGEAHGTNKAMLMARGELIKIITDDDVFDFELIMQAKQFLILNKNIDVLGFDGWGYNFSQKVFEKTNYIAGFKQWKERNTPFLFCGLSLLIRKESLSHLGLLSTSFKIVDMEYTIRISSQKTKIAFCTAIGFVNIVTPSSNSQKFYKIIREEQKLLKKIYPAITQRFKINHPIIVLKDKFKGLKKTKSNIIYNQEDHLNDYLIIVKTSIEKLKSDKKNNQYLFLV